jgi:hypothetical protein
MLTIDQVICLLNDNLDPLLPAGVLLLGKGFYPKEE